MYIPSTFINNGFTCKPWHGKCDLHLEIWLFQMHLLDSSLYVFAQTILHLSGGQADRQANYTLILGDLQSDVHSSISH